MASAQEGGREASATCLRAGFPPGVHNMVHQWVGGAMEPPSSPNEPAFFLHHCNLDRLWAEWRQRHPGAPYVPVSNLSDVLPPWNERTIADLLDHRALGCQYDTEFPLPQGHQMLPGLRRTRERARVLRRVRRNISTVTAAVTSSPDKPRCSASPYTTSRAAPASPWTATRSDTKTRPGADFSNVRLHTGTAELRCRDRRPRPHLRQPHRHTLAHELTHVIQQRQGPVAGTDSGPASRSPTLRTATSGKRKPMPPEWRPAAPPWCRTSDSTFRQRTRSPFRGT
ncbi:tyrosinase family protein [Streptomyces halstedii]|uniref:eCIS core domain-containing protein n=2 Tax=Streptomyces halstedii TaxID=1944 RepID=UPI003F4D82F1